MTICRTHLPKQVSKMDSLEIRERLKRCVGDPLLVSSRIERDVYKQVHEHEYICEKHEDEHPRCIVLPHIDV